MRILRGGRGDAVIMVVTLLGTLLLHLETAVLLGIALSFARYIMRTSTPRVHAVVPEEGFNHFTYDPDRPECPQLGIIEILGDLYFGAVNYVEDFILDHSAQHPDQIYLLLRMHNVNNLDFSGVHMLENVVRSLSRARRRCLHGARQASVMGQRMTDTGFDEYLGQDHFLNEDSAISDLFYHVLNPAGCIYECPYRVFRECQNLPKRLDLIDIGTRERRRHAGSSIGLMPRICGTIFTGERRTKCQSSSMCASRENTVRATLRRRFRCRLTLFKEGDPGLPQDREIVLVCRTSRRSRLAAGALQKLGYENLTILRWRYDFMGSGRPAGSRSKPFPIMENRHDYNVPFRNIGLELVRVTENAAFAASRWIGSGKRGARIRPRTKPCMTHLVTRDQRPDRYCGRTAHP